MPTKTINRHGSAPMKDFGVIFSGGAAPFLSPLFKPPRGGFAFAIQFRCYSMRLLTSLILATILLFGCASAPKEIALPSKTEGGWKQDSVAAMDASKKPEWMERLGVQDAKTAKYSGPIDVEVHQFRLSSSAAALECTQLWKKVPSESVMMKENYFFVLRTEHPNREMLMDFSRALEKAL